MNPNESEFEERLRALTPVAPSPALAEAIASELKPREAALAVRVPTAAILARPTAQKRTLSNILRGLGWACAGAGVAVAAILATERGDDRPQPAPVAAAETASSFDLTESSAEILTAQDEGFVYAADESLARRIRYNSMERHVWRNASTGAWLEIEIPREDVRFMPVAMQ